MRHLDLFSGIGGFAYAADQVWPDVEHTFCDNDPFCRAVLRKHWPESEIFDDIRQIDSNPFDPRLEGSQQDKSTRHGRQPGGKRSDKAPFLLTGGFPCQPFSAAGLRRGTSDDRYLWPEMLRVIRLAAPTWVIAENVRGLITWNDGMVLEQVCTDLEGEGYEVQPVIIPAVAINAPHRRDRIWFIGHAEHDGQHATKDREGNPKRADSHTKRPDEVRQPQGTDSLRTDAQNTVSQRSRGRDENGRQVLERQSTEVQDARPGWEAHWFEVATQFCSVDDGLPVKLDGFELSKPQHRKAQLKAYGNAIVPQVALQIMQAIAEAEASEVALAA